MVVAQFKTRSFTSFRMTTPIKCHSERSEESLLVRFAENLCRSTKMSHYPKITAGLSSPC